VRRDANLRVGGGVARCVDRIAVASLLALTAAACGMSEPESSELQDQVGVGPAIAKTQDDWHGAMRELAMPAKGCFTSEFPRVEWKQVACATPPNLPYPPVRGRRPQTVGNGTDWAARVSSGLISAAEGSFDAVLGVTNIDSMPSGGVSAYSLQLNTQFFTTPVCGPSPNPNCRGWQQFIYSNTGFAFMQYWLIQYNTACPAGWNTVPFGTDTYCFRNAPGGVTISPQAIANLIHMKLGATAVLGGNDSVSIDTGGGGMAAMNNDNVLSLAGAWTDAEFNLVGDCCGSESTFNAGSTVTVHTTVHNGTTNAPTCQLEGFTGETNSLTLVGTPALLGLLPSPGMVFNQTNVTPFTASSCASAGGVGDPHMTTVLGTYYDFQASGDFIAADTGPDFTVQTRQASGAPTWPNAAVHKAVGTRMGKTTVAVCLEPTRLEINGKRTALSDGKRLALADGVDVSRQGNVYLVTGPHGDSMRAEVQSSYINLGVGFGSWPVTVRGLLGNGKSASEIVARDGSVFQEPVSFETRYKRFGDSWRVPDSEAFLCKDDKVEIRNPDAPFCLSDLDPKLREHAQAICARAGVKQGPLLDACVLDVAMLGDDKAAANFVNAVPPVVVGGNGCKQ
jgi:hypothetical protein